MIGKIEYEDVSELIDFEFRTDHGSGDAHAAKSSS
jgi:hypothetical protein